MDFLWTEIKNCQKCHFRPHIGFRKWPSGLFLSIFDQNWPFLAFNLRRQGGGSEVFFSLLICYSNRKMLLVSFYGIQKYAFFFEWQTFENTDSFIIQYKNFHKNQNYGKLRKLQNNLAGSRQCMYRYEILTQYTFMVFPYFYLGGFLIFLFLRPKTAIFTIFGRGETRER